MSQIESSPNIHYKQNVEQDKYKNVPKPYMRVAEGMEAQFTNHLLGQMRKSINSTEPQSQAEKVYKSMLDDERSQMMAKSDSGLGIKDLVLNQIYPQYKKQPSQAINAYNNVTLTKERSNE